MDQGLWDVAERTVTPLIHPWTPGLAQALAPGRPSGNKCGMSRCVPSSGTNCPDPLHFLSVSFLSSLQPGEKSQVGAKATGIGPLSWCDTDFPCGLRIFSGLDQMPPTSQSLHFVFSSPLPPPARPPKRGESGFQGRFASIRYILCQLPFACDPYRTVSSMRTDPDLPLFSVCPQLSLSTLPGM